MAAGNAVRKAANDNRPPSEKKQTIGTFTAMALVGVAILFDGLQIIATFLHILPIPLVATALATLIPFYISIVAQMIFFMWFALLGVNANAGNRVFSKRFFIAMGTFIAEFVPLINALPVITVSVISLIAVSRAEDALGSPRKTMIRRVVRGGQSEEQLPEESEEEEQAPDESDAAAKEAEAKRRRNAPWMDYRDELKQRQTGESLRGDFETSTGSETRERFKQRYGAPGKEAREQGTSGLS